MEDARHCPDCRNEFVAHVEVCSDCGRPLQPGELPRVSTRREEEPAHEVGIPEHGVPPEAPDPPDTLVATLPGEDAEQVARALALEQITSLLDCDGTQELRGPFEPPKPALARRKPVSIYVAAQHVDDAHAVIESLMHEDPIGEQWRGAHAGTSAVPDLDDEIAAESEFSVAVAEPAGMEVPHAEGVGYTWIVLIALGAILALFVALL